MVSNGSLIILLNAKYKLFYEKMLIYAYIHTIGIGFKIEVIA
jgi:hypothetical protein